MDLQHEPDEHNNGSAAYAGLTLPIHLQTAIRACVAGGKLVVVGLGAEEAKLPVASAACKEIDIIGSFRYANTVRPILC